MRLIFRVIKLFFLILILSLIFHDIAGKIYLTLFLRWSLGVPVHIENVQVDLRDTELEIKGLRLSNPSGFPEGTLLNVPKIYLDLEAWDLLKGRIHIEDFEIDCRDIRIIRDMDGRINWLSLKPLKTQKVKSKTEQPVFGEPSLFQIDRLVLSLGTASYLDLYSDNALQKNLNLNVRDAVFTNVDSFQGLVKIIVWETIRRVGVKQMTAAFENLTQPSKAEGLLKKAFHGIKLKF